MNDDGRIVIVFKPLPDTVPANVRIRRLLKYALRAMRLKCVSIIPDEREEACTR